MRWSMVAFQLRVCGALSSPNSIPETFCDVFEPALAEEHDARSESLLNEQLLLKLFSPKGESSMPFAVTLL